MKASELAEDASDALAYARHLMSKSKRILVFSGAGISTDSGIPDFRGPKGVWTRDPSHRRLVDVRALISDEDVRVQGWQWLSSQRLGEYKPNRGHEAVAGLAHHGKLLLCVTQNTDGLQELAGLPKDLLVTIHGSRRHVNCMGRSGEAWLDFASKPETPSKFADSSDVRRPCNYWCHTEELLKRVEAGEKDPRCPCCGFIMKTADISFGQSLVQADITRSLKAAQSCDLVLAIGTKMSVYPIANMVPEAKAAGARIVIVNGEETAMDSLADVVLRGSISSILTDIICRGSSNRDSSPRARAPGYLQLPLQERRESYEYPATAALQVQ